MLNARMALASSRREDINLLLGLDPTLRFTESEYKGAIFAQIATSFKSICANGVFFMQWSQKIQPKSNQMLCTSPALTLKCAVYSTQTVSARHRPGCS
jgi:hypothetical protein